MKKIIFPLIALILLSLTGCGAPAVTEEPSATAEFFAMDTYCTVTVYGDSEADFETLTRQAVAEAQSLLTSSATDNIYIAMAANQTLNLSAEATEVIKKAYEINSLSGGMFDLSIAPLTVLWNISERTVPPSETEISTAKRLCGTDKMIFAENLRSLIFTTAGTGIDIGSVGKGYAADLAAKRLLEAGFYAGIINLGGNVTVFGQRQSRPAFSIGIKNPASAVNLETVGKLHIRSGSVITSGSYERYFSYEGTRYHHIIDPRTGSPAAGDLLSVTVVSEDGVYGDAMSTAGFVAGSVEAVGLLESAVSKGMISGAVLVTTKKQVRVIGDISFTLDDKDYTLYEN